MVNESKYAHRSRETHIIERGVLPDGARCVRDEHGEQRGGVDGAGLDDDGGEGAEGDERWAG